VLGGGSAADTIVGGAGNDWLAADASPDGLWWYMWAASGARHNSGGVPLERTFTGAFVLDNGRGDLLYADDMPPAAVEQSPAAAAPADAAAAGSTSGDVVVTTLAPTPATAAAGTTNSLSALLKGDRDEVWGGVL